MEYFSCIPDLLLLIIDRSDKEIQTEYVYLLDMRVAIGGVFVRCRLVVGQTACFQSDSN